MSDTALILILILACLSNISLVVYSWTRRKSPGAMAFAFSAILFTIWPFIQAIDLNISDLNFKIFLMKSRLDAPVFGGIAWLVMVAQLTGRKELFTWKRLAVISSIPILTMILNQTGYSTIYRHSYYVDQSGAFPILHWINGFWFWVWFVWSYSIFLASFFLLGRSYRDLTHLTRLQVFGVSFAFGLPLIVNLLFQMDITPVEGFNFTPVVFSVSGGIIAWAIFRYHLFNVVPMARGLLIDSMTDGVLVLDPQNRVVDINPAMLKMIGKTKEELIAKPIQTLFAAWPEMLESLQSPSETHTEITLDGDPPHYFDLRLSPLSNQFGLFYGQLAIVRDVSVQKRIGRELETSKNNLKAHNKQLSFLHKITLDLINHHAVDDLLQSITDQASEFLNVPYCEILLQEGDELVVKAYTRNQEFLEGDRVTRDEAHLSWQAFDTGLPAVINDYSNWHLSRDVYSDLDLKAVASIPIIAHGVSIGVLDLSRNQLQQPFDESEIHAATLFTQLAAVALDNVQLHESLRQEAIRDSLTGLFNRRFMEETLAKEMERAQRKSQPLTLVMLDMDNLKEINDTYGHNIGDDAIRDISLLLRTKIRAGDTACRYGGDEFIIILPETTADHAKKRMEEFITEVKALSIYHEGKPIKPIGLSIGIAEFPHHGELAPELLKSADNALYKAKESGRNTIKVN